MVFVSRFLYNEFRKFKKIRGTYLDKVRILVRGGTGGAGNPKYGGIGGKGGDVYIEGARVPDFRALAQKYPEKRFFAGHGCNSESRQLLGKRGTDLIIDVPCGVKAISEFNTVLGEVNEINQRVLIAKGGVGGCPATNFSPRRGEKFNVVLELSIVSDISIVGFPNAGKSTFLRACSNAKPKVADYPFTTIKPNLGIMNFPDGRKITIADLPGLIEGAHQNYGMGHQFLRHVERCRSIMMIVDVFGFQLRHDRPVRTAFETVMLLNKELELYNSDFLKRPISLIVNKMDLPGSLERFMELKEKLGKIEEAVQELPQFMKPESLIQFEDIIPISAKSGDDIENAKNHLRSVIDSNANANEEEINDKFNKLRLEIRGFGPLIT